MNFGYTSFLHSMLVVMIDYFNVFFHLPCINWTKSPNFKKKKKLRWNFVKLISRKLYFFANFILFGNLVLVVSEKMAWNIEWVIGSFVETLHVGERALMAPSSRARISIWPHCFVQIIARSSGVIFDRRLQSG